MFLTYVMYVLAEMAPSAFLLGMVFSSSPPRLSSRQRRRRRAGTPAAPPTYPPPSPSPRRRARPGRSTGDLPADDVPGAPSFSAAADSVSSPIAPPPAPPPPPPPPRPPSRRWRRRGAGVGRRNAGASSSSPWYDSISALKLPLSRHEIVVGALYHGLGHDDDVIRLVHELELVRDEEHRFVGELLRDALPEDILGDVRVERG